MPTINLYTKGIETIKQANIEAQDENSLTVVFKKPRSPKYLRQVIPMGQVVIAYNVEGEDASTVLVKSDRVLLDSLEGEVTITETGATIVTTEYGEVTIPAGVEVEIVEEVDEPTSGKKKSGGKPAAGKGKGKGKGKPVEEEEEEEEEEPAPKGKGKGKGKPAGKGKSKDDDNGEW